MAKTFTYTFSNPPGGSIRITTGNTPQSVTTSDGSAYQGYAITGISGTFNGENISSLIGAGGTEGLDPNYTDEQFDNTIFTTATQGAQGASFDGVDLDGFAFSTQSENSYNIYQNGSSLVFDKNGGGTTAAPIASTNYATVCFAAGTLIRTKRGDVAVEHLVVGEHVVTASGAHRPIKWLGHRDTDCAHHPDPRKVWPVRVRAGTLAGGLPYADLWLSPGHALCLDDVLIPVRGLIYGDAIAQVERASVTYWHVELDSHDILLANGAAAESYLDTGNRSAFDNASGIVDLHPVFEARDTGRFCRPFVESGPQLTAARLRLFGASDVPAVEPVHMLADGAVLRGMVGEREAVFVIPAGTRELSLMSLRFEPSGADVRTLGVIVNAITIEAGGIIRPVVLDDPALRAGFFDIEDSDGLPWRWTDGAGHLDASLWAGCKGGFVLRIGGMFDVVRGADEEGCRIAA